MLRLITSANSEVLTWTHDLKVEVSENLLLRNKVVLKESEYLKVEVSEK